MNISTAGMPKLRARGYGKSQRIALVAKLQFKFLHFCARGCARCVLVAVGGGDCADDGWGELCSDVGGVTTVSML